MLQNITLEMRLKDLGYEPIRTFDNDVKVNCYDKRFTKTELSTLLDLASIYNIQKFTVYKDYAKFYVGE